MQGENKVERPAGIIVPRKDSARGSRRSIFGLGTASDGYQIPRQGALLGRQARWCADRIIFQSADGWQFRFI